MWFVNVGPYRFRASSSDSVLGIDLGVSCKYDNVISANSVTSASFNDTHTHTH